MESVYDSILVAEFLRAKAFEKGLEIGISRIQKMMYIIYGLYLAKFDSPLLNEQPRAWPSGPVFPKVDSDSHLKGFHSVNDPKFDEIKKHYVVVKAIDDIIKCYGRSNEGDLGWYLRIERAPWRKATSKPQFMWNDIIDDADIKSYFKMFQKTKSATNDIPV